MKKKTNTKYKRKKLTRMMIKEIKEKNTHQEFLKGIAAFFAGVAVTISQNQHRFAFGSRPVGKNTKKEEKK
jgi:hypothetical protein